MSGNPTAGILLIVGASLLIVFGFTDKGKQILSIITGAIPSASSNSGDGSIDPKDFAPGGKYDPDSEANKKTRQSGGYIPVPGAPSLASYPGTFAGEKGAVKI